MKEFCSALVKVQVFELKTRKTAFYCEKYTQEVKIIWKEEGLVYSIQIRTLS